jgi:hypothetical protein
MHGLFLENVSPEYQSSYGQLAIILHNKITIDDSN